ncbi:MAG: flagellar basal body P-ring formation chaperone FlgA [Methylophilaceae bacterium]|nr:flagellar basal body P-ring formation chaperone FlgA [Methylophilus sp.]
MRHLTKPGLNAESLNTLGASLILLCASLLVTGQAKAATTLAMLPNQPVRQEPIKQDLLRQDLAAVKSRITEFLVTQTIGYPGKVSVNAGSIDPNLRLAACPDPQVFMPQGSRAWGKTSVGVRCNAPNIWTIYVQATVSITAQYLVAAAPLAQGRIISSQDLIFESGDLTQLPAGVFTDIGQAVGRSVNISMNAGTVLRQEMLKMAPVVQQGQTVMVTSTGKGFSVSAEGQAMANAIEGQIVQVKVANGQVVNGIARNGGQIEVGF